MNAIQFLVDAPNTADFANLESRVTTLEGAPTPAVTVKHVSEFVLFAHPSHPVIGQPGGAAYTWPGNALTASTFMFYGSRAGNLLYAQWVLVWNPDTAESPTGVRLVSADSGPTNIAALATITEAGTITPIVRAADVTVALQAIIAAGQDKHIGQQTAGNGGNGPKIYKSAIECWWG